MIVRLLLSLGVLLLGGCPFVYDSQYNDRANELDEFRREIFPADAGVQLLASGGAKLYWVDVVRPADVNVLHSIEPPDTTKTDYDWSAGDISIQDYRFSDQIISECRFGTVRAYNANASDTSDGTEIGATSFGEAGCVVDGGTVYFRQTDGIARWVPAPPASPPVPLPLAINFETETDLQGVSGFGVIGNLALVTESGGDIYTINLTTKETTWLENEVSALDFANLFFDDKVVFFETMNEGPRFILYQDKVERSFNAVVADGGYHLSFQQADIHLPDEPLELVIHGKHVVYRGNRGIFAYGLETGNVVDLLLDRGDGVEATLEYRNLTVTSNGFLFVQARNSFGENEGPVYQVDLNGRLK